jgi:hypothetical protein
MHGTPFFPQACRDIDDEFAGESCRLCAILPNFIEPLAADPPKKRYEESKGKRIHCGAGKAGICPDISMRMMRE